MPRKAKSNARGSKYDYHQGDLLSDRHGYQTQKDDIDLEIDQIILKQAQEQEMLSKKHKMEDVSQAQS